MNARMESKAGSARRGSFLVLVVGTLALLAVITVIYVTVGNQDVRTRASHAKRETLDEIPGQFRDYVLGRIIGPDTHATWYDDRTDTTTAGAVRAFRKTSDYPSVLWDVRSDVAGTDARAFYPVADARPAETLTSRPDRWLPTTPWLASGEPTFLDFAGAGVADPLRPYLERRDLWSISNLAPDGRFVNLFNLRDNFDAPSGSARGEMSYALSLFDANGRATPTTDFGVAADLDVPAFFTMRQRGAFRPVDFNPGNEPFSSPDWPRYQWADADGDGMLDSRWFQLVDGRDPSKPIDYLNTSGQYRYFFAARVVDLSGRINVNTAGDLRARATVDAPVGVTPADIDLRRLLMLQDAYDDATQAGASAQSTAGGYDGLFDAPPPADGGPPPPGGTADDFGAYLRLQAFRTGASGYEALRMALASGQVPPKDRPTDPTWTYADVYPPVTRPSTGLAQFASDVGVGDVNLLSPTEAKKWGRWELTKPAVANVTMSPDQRRSEFFRQSAQGQLGVDLSYTAAATSGDVLLRGLFGADDAADLLTYNGLNDPTITSNLELTLAGRDATAGAFPGSRRYSPLRDNRSRDTERGLGVNAFAWYASVQNAANSPFDRTQRHFAVDVRRRLTPVSGARPLRTLADVNPGVIAPEELKIDAPAALRNGTVSSLFRGYADALAGHSARAGAWSPTTNSMSTLFYGYKGPEAAIHIAAHMALNMADMADNDSIPQVRPVVLWPQGAAAAYNDDAALPASERVLTTYQGLRLELDSTRLSTGSLTTPPVALVYGVEPQPFVTQVVTMSVYADLPATLGGDTDDTGEITIQGGASSTDLLYRLTAFQLANPFDRTITLGSNDGLEFQQFYNVTNPAYPAIDRDNRFYYIEFGGLYYKVASLAEKTMILQPQADAAHAAFQPAVGTTNPAERGNYAAVTPGTQYMTLEPITIQPGRTVVLIAMSRIPRQFLGDRMVPLDSTTNPNNPKFINDLVKHNLGLGNTDIGTEVYYIPRMDVTTGEAVLPPAAPGHLQVVPNGLSSGLGNLAVNLYHTVREGDELLVNDTDTRPGTFWDGVTTPQNAPPAQVRRRNFYANDQLVDRLRIPSGVNMDRVLPGGPRGTGVQHNVTGTDGTQANEQNGATVAYWVSVRRPANPSLAGGLKRGMIPAYCLEPKYNTTWNSSDNEGFTPGSGNIPNGAISPNGTNTGSDSFARFRNKMTTPQRIMRDVSQAPSQWSGAGPAANPAFTAGTSNYNAIMPALPTAPARASAGPNLNGFEALGSATPPVNANSPAVVSILRVTDMLLPFGVGPTFTPYDPSGGTRYTDSTDPDKLLRWTTLGEAICMAMGYDTLPQPAPAAADVAYLLAPRPVSGGAYRALFDRMHLVLDDYVPFVDANSNGEFNAASDRRMGLELPLALHVLDAFHAGQTSPALDKAIPGTVNINTAPLAVLRCLPLLSPPWTQSTAFQNDPLNERWWWRGGPPPPGLDEHVDVASALAGYRDKSDTPVRQSAVEAGIGLPRDGYISFADESAPGTRTPPNDPYTTLSGRSLSTQIGATPTSQGTGVGEQPGLRSTGELMAVRMRTVDPSSAKYRFNIDHLGFDTTTPAPFSGGTPVDSDAPGFTSLNPSTTSTTASSYSIANDYKEKLAIAGGVMNTISTRSDYFAVWFLVHGYKRGDCEGLPNDAALVPSVQRRFLMVVDRSGVTQEGQKPRVLLFKEVPL